MEINLFNALFGVSEEEFRAAPFAGTFTWNAYNIDALRDEIKRVASNHYAENREAINSKEALHQALTRLAETRLLRAKKEAEEEASIGYDM